MRCVIILLCLFASPASVEELKLFQHPSGIFEIMVPADWNISHPMGGNNITTFNPKNGKADLTISVSKNLNLPSELPEFTVTSMFPNEIPISKLTRRRGQNWNSIRQDWSGINNGVKTIWLAEFFGYKTNAIAITLSDEEIAIANQKDLFERIVRSIKFK